jgi:hypothetical protein
MRRCILPLINGVKFALISTPTHESGQCRTSALNGTAPLLHRFLNLFCGCTVFGSKYSNAAACIMHGMAVEVGRDGGSIRKRMGF